MVTEVRSRLQLSALISEVRFLIYNIYALEEIPAHEHKSKDLDADYKQPKPRKPYIPPMNHPWRLDAFNKFAHSQPHRIEEDIKSA